MGKLNRWLKGKGNYIMRLYIYIYIYEKECYRDTKRDSEG